jgi:hypothetical protein
MLLAILNNLGAPKNATCTRRSNTPACGVRGSGARILPDSFMSTNVAVAESRPASQPVSHSEICRCVFAACASQSRQSTMSSLTSQCALQWRRELKITSIYLGRSRPRIIHSRAPAADEEGRVGTNVARRV